MGLDADATFAWILLGICCNARILSNVQECRQSAVYNLIDFEFARTGSMTKVSLHSQRRLTLSSCFVLKAQLMRHNAMSGLQTACTVPARQALAIR